MKYQILFSRKNKKKKKPFKMSSAEFLTNMQSVNLYRTAFIVGDYLSYYYCYFFVFSTEAAGGGSKKKKSSAFQTISATHRVCIIKIQSTLVISNSKGLTEILRDIHTSTYQS